MRISLIERSNLRVAFAVFCGLMMGPVWAQDSSPSAATFEVSDGVVEEVVVTGSRIRRENGYDQPTPVTSITSEALQAAAPSNIADGLNQLPQFKPTDTRSLCCAIGSVGNYLNLRGLGTSRVLVLLDGYRIAPTRQSGDVDVNLLPEMLVKRVDVVTGGASAVYGSDAVSGVVNYVIDQDFTGFKAIAQAGTSGESDNDEVKFGIAGGMSFASGRGQVVASFEHYESDGFRIDAREQARNGHYLGGVGAPTLPFENLFGIVSIGATNGGVIVNETNFLPEADAGAPLAGTLFLPGGTTRPFEMGPRVVGITPVASGGDGFVYGAGSALAELETDKLYTRLNYDISDNLSAHVRLNAAESSTVQYTLESSARGGTAFTIFRDNAFLPDSVGAQMDAAGVGSFRLAREHNDWGMIGNDITNTTYDINIGLDGAFAGTSWTWQANYSTGETELDGGAINDPIIENVYAATDAVIDPASGNIVCNVTLTNPGEFPGCEPFNPFGEGSTSAAALGYMVGTSDQVITNGQDILSIGAQGEWFDMPAGPLAVAVGTEYIQRDLKMTSNPYALTQVNPTGIRGLPTNYCPTPETCQFGRWAQGNFGEADASDSRYEVYGEFLAPLLRDRPGAHLLELNGAYRYTDYEYSGGVNTWKVGLDYMPTESLRFRATTSRDIRAPNLFELFAGPTRSFGSTTLIFDPLNPGGIPGNYVNLSQGNPTLEPETGDTVTIGFVYEPSWLPGFSGSIDYFDIQIDDAIADTTPQSVINRCAQGDQMSCDAISRDPTTTAITQIVVQKINLDSTSVRGIDFDLSYQREVGPGLLKLRLIATNAQERVEVVGDAVTDYAGFTADPEWRGNLTAAYDVGNFYFFWQQRYVNSVQKWAFVPGGPQFKDPDFPSVSYTDVTASWNIGGSGFELYATINNLFDKKPPLQPTPFVPGLAFPISPAGNPNYDMVGSMYTVGARMVF